MKEENAPLTSLESLELITEMIQQAKGNIQRNSFYFLLWGWVIALANIGHFIILQYTTYPRPYLVWLIAIPAYMVTWIYGRRTKDQIVRTHLDRIHGFMWMGFGFCVPVVILFGNQINHMINPMIMLLASLPTFLSGVMLKFRPLLVGGVLLWIASIVGFMIPPEYQFPLMAVAIILGYLVPGYMLGKTE